MKPNFALILSMDGIALLQRASPGWALVGDAYPDSPDLADQMAGLRADAERLAPGEATFKVVIPNDQIRYLSIPAGSPDPTVRTQEVEAALDGATPYALDELAVDHTVAGRNIQIAAVALETLQEADEFARNFGFDPVSFVAMPEGKEYSGEPFFGTAHDVPDSVNVEPDSTAIRVSGRVRMPSPETADAAPPKDDRPAPTEEPGDAPADSAPVSFSSVRARNGEETTEGAPRVERDPAPRDDAPRITFAEPEAGKSPAPVVLPARDIQPEELSNSLKADEPDFETEDRKSALSGMLSAGAGLVSRLNAGVANRRAARSEARAKARADKEKAAARRAEEAAAQAALPKLPVGAQGISNPAPTAGATRATSGPAAKSGQDPAGEKTSRRKRKGKAKAAAPAVAVSAETAAPTGGTNPTPEKTAPSTKGAGDAPRRIGALTADERRAEEERLTVFGARNGSYDTGGRGSIGLVVAIVVAVFLAGSAGWAALFSDASLSALFGGQAATEETLAALPPGEVEDGFVPPGPGEETIPDSEEIAEDEATSTDAPAAEPEAASDETTGADSDSPLIVTEAATAPPEDAAPEVSADDGTMSAEDEARYAASGIWQESPDGITGTATGTAETGTDGTADADTPPERGPTVELAALTPDSRPAPPPPPPEFGRRYYMDARGLVIATPDGAETPSGVIAFAGDPPVVPPARPGETLEPAADDTPVEAPRQEEADPASDAELTEEPQPGTAPEDNRFADVRPRLRPADVIAQAGPETAEAEEAAPATEQTDVILASAASLAGSAVTADEGRSALVDDAARASIAAGIASATDAQEDAAAADTAEAGPEDAGIEPSFIALRPIQRPGNIGQLAAAARVTQEPAPAIQPSGPTSVSVARQATLRNAIDLREVNLIGVYGQPSDRRALVRLSNGRYRKVKVGDRMDGGRVLAIGDDTLRYQKNGRNLTLNMPSG